MTKKAENQIKYTLSTMAIEQIAPSSEALSLCEAMADSRITADEAVNSVLERYGLRKANA